MQYDFGRVIDRTSTNDMKWHSKAVESYLNLPIPEKMIPMWLADTEFAAPPVIVSALAARVEKEIFGYCAPMESFYRAICRWEKMRFDFDIDPSWIGYIPTVVAGINIAVRAYTKEGEGVIIQQPVYDPFASIVKRAHRKLVNNGLVLNNGRYEMNLPELEELASKPENRLLVLCSPHNPVGRVWTKEELSAVGDICLRNNVRVISDEIHSDIVFSGHTHFPLLSLDKRYLRNFIHLSSPGKTFNVAGLKSAFSIISDEKLRREFNETQVEMSLDIRNTFGIEATIAAYTDEGQEWAEQEIAYIESNMDFLRSFVEEHMPGASMIYPEGTFLAFIDLSGLGLSDEEISKRVILEAAVICVPGAWFGPGGEKHLRINAGCQRSMLEEAMERIRKVLYR